MRIVTKILSILTIATVLATASISLYIIQNPLNENPPIITIDDSKELGSDEDNSEDDDLTDIRFYGIWERYDDTSVLNISNLDSKSSKYSTDIALSICNSESNINNSMSNSDGEGDTSPPSGQDDHSDSTLTFLQGNYDISTKNRTITRIDNGEKITFSYDFSNNNNTLKLTNIETKESYIYQRHIYNVNNSNDLKKYNYQKVNITGKLYFNTSSDWSNLTLSDQRIVPVNLSNVKYDFNEIHGKTVSFNANIVPLDMNYTWSNPSYIDSNCSCILSNVDSESIQVTEE